MKNKILVCASVAYDHLMTFEGVFNETINLSTIDSLSVSFLADTREKYYGGCGANIAYSLGLLNHSPILFTAVGVDFSDYEEWLKKHKVNTDYLARVDGELTSSAFILSDKKENQITVFSPGVSANTNYAMSFEALPIEDLAYVIIGPENPLRVMSLVDQCIRLQLPYIFDPGQITHVLGKEDLDKAVTNSFGLMANEFETKILEEKLEKPAKDFCNEDQFFISTLGENGCLVFQDEYQQKVDAIRAEKSVDPTGCGDAFRAGLLAGLCEGKSLNEAVNMGVLMGTIAVQKKGTQNHYFTRKDFDGYFSDTFKELSPV